MADTEGESAADAASALEWSKLDETTRSQLRGTSCKKAAKHAPNLGFCPVCRNQTKKPCLLKAGGWPCENVEEGASTAVVAYCSPEKQGSASLNVTDARRQRREVDLQFGTPTKFRDKATGRKQRAFLDKHFESSLKGGERMRDKKVLQLMKAEFGRRRGEDGRSLVLAVTDPGLL